MLSAVGGVLDLLGGGGPRDEDLLTSYAYALSPTAPVELKAIESHARALNLYVNVGDAAGQVAACDSLVEMMRRGAAGLAGWAVMGATQTHAAERCRSHRRV